MPIKIKLKVPAPGRGKGLALSGQLLSSGREEVTSCPPPSCSPDTLVASLKAGSEVRKQQGFLLPEWDDDWIEQLSTKQKAVKHPAEPAPKRPKHQTADLYETQTTADLPEVAKATNYLEQSLHHSSGALQQPVLLSGQQESNSDLATTSNTEFATPEHAAQHTSKHSEVGPGLQHASDHQKVKQSAGNKSQLPNGLTVSTSVGETPVLAPNFLAGGQAMVSSPFDNITPADMQLEASKRQTAHGQTEEEVTAEFQKLYANAKAIKKNVDKRREQQQPQQQWTAILLSEYVKAAVKFMEASEYLTSKQKNSKGSDSRHADRVSNACGLYTSTIEFLEYTIKLLSSARGSEVAKDMLRVMCERLCAICHLRLAMLAPKKFNDAAQKLQRMIAEQQQKLHQQTATGTSLASLPQVQESPHDSSTSSPAALATQIPVGRPADWMGHFPDSILHAAKQVSRFSDYTRKSTAGFQALIERTDVNSDEHGRLACMHIAALCVDAGMMGCYSLISHAEAALLHVACVGAA